MSDLFQRVANAPVGKEIVGRLGLPRPVELARYRPGQPAISGPVLVGGRGRLLAPITEALEAAGANVLSSGSGPVGGLVFDATAITDPEGLRELYDFFHPVVRSLRESGRLLVLGTQPESLSDPRAQIAQRALEGFTRSMAKEVGNGSTAQLIYVADGAEAGIASTLRFFLSPKSAYVSGQVVRIEKADKKDVAAPQTWERPLEGKVAVVTGSARGIGEAIAETLARDGATVVCVDVPGAATALSAVAASIGGEALQLDVTAEDAPSTLASYLKEHHGGVDVIVHNAGITRDKTLGRMSEEQWDLLLNINLRSQLAINDELLSSDVLRAGGRIVGVSSIAGIAGNRGQSNYATSKAGVIGMVNAMAPLLRKSHITINAVAPGFIETAMTAAMPLATREAGRRLNSVAQGGLPVDVAETISWFASPASGAVNGNVVRVCGQSLLGA